MKVVQINTVVGSGSVGRITADLYELMMNNGIQSIVCYGRNQAPDGIEAYKIENLVEFGSHVLRNFIKGESGFGSKNATKRLLHFLEKERPDIIHLHNIHGFYLHIEMLFSYLRTSKIPVVWTLHDCWPMTGHCAYFDFANCGRWKEGCFSCPQQRSAYPYALLKDNSFANYIRKEKAFTGLERLSIVTPSKWLQNIVKQSFLKEYPIEVLRNGIDLSVFKPQVKKRRGQPPQQTKEYLVLGVANIWENRKGLMYFEKLAESLPEEYKIILVGIQPKQARRLKQKENNGRLPIGKILPIERTDSKEALAALYSKADVYVNATLEDNFPTTNLEALACGTPVITFATGGSPEALTEQTGIVVEKGNVQELAKAVQQIIKEPKEKGKPFSRECCREQALRFEQKECLGKYLKLYQKIIQ